MGDNSPKSKQRGQKQKDLAKERAVAAAQAKQDRQKRIPQGMAKDKK
jgi:hypothetical protein